MLKPQERNGASFDPAPSPDELAAQQRGERAFGSLPHIVVRDEALSPEGLVAIGFRATFVDDEKEYGLSATVLKRIVRTGLGQNVAERAIRNACHLELLKRWQPPATFADGKWQPRRAVDRLTLPAVPEHEQLVVQRRWFSGALSVKELAALLYIRAGTGRGPDVYARELRARFSWSEGTADKVLVALVLYGLAERTNRRGPTGQFAGVAYSPIWKTPEVVEPIAKNTAPQKPGHRMRGRSNQGRIQKVRPAQNVPREQTRDATQPSGCAPAREKAACAARAATSVGDCGTRQGTPDDVDAALSSSASNDCARAERPAQPSGRDWITLAPWHHSAWVQRNGFVLPDDEDPVMPLARWRAILQRAPGMPGHLLTSHALKEAQSLAAFLIADDRCDVDLEQAVIGVAGAICAAHVKGKTIRSLGLIAPALYGAAREGETAWAYSIPPMIDAAAYDRAAGLVAHIADHLEDYEFPIDRDLLESTLEVEYVAKLLTRTTAQVICDGISADLKAGHRPPADHVIPGWCWFAKAINAAMETANAAATAEAKKAAKRATDRRRRARERERWSY